MGALCSKRASADCSTSRNISHVNGHINYGSDQMVHHPSNVNVISDISEDPTDTSLPDPSSIEEVSEDINDGIPKFSGPLSQKSRPRKAKQAVVAKVSAVSSRLGRVGTKGLGKAVEVLDTVGSSMTSLQFGSGFVSGVNTKEDRISILAFEVANTIVKGANLMQALSEDSIKHLKEVVLPSESVQHLTSKDTNELLRIAAADKRDELQIFSGEIVRFGNRCKDPQWHNLERYFEKLGSELAHQKQRKKEAENVMHQLIIYAQYTAELYHQLNALDRFEQDYRRKLQQEEYPTSSGDSVAILRAEVKIQRKHVKSLKKKSLWSMVLEEVMEKLVEIVHFLHLEIHKAFGTADGDTPVENNCEKLGPAGLALHYANIITQIDKLATRASSVPASTRDALYQGLPHNVKSALRSKLQTFHVGEEFTAAQIKAEMEKILHWLVPMASNTTKAHLGFGWVGEWANTGKLAGQGDLIRLETLHHADKDKTETYILELVVWLHHLVSRSRSVNGANRSPIKSPLRSPNRKTIQLMLNKPSSPLPPLTVEDQDMLRDVDKRKLTPGISKSQEFDTGKSTLRKLQRLTKSRSHSSTRETNTSHFPVRRPSSAPTIISMPST